VQQVVGYLGYTGRAADVVVTTAHDPHQTSVELPALSLDAGSLDYRPPFLGIGRPFAPLRIDATWSTPTWRPTAPLAL